MAYRSLKLVCISHYNPHSHRSTAFQLLLGMYTFACIAFRYAFLTAYADQIMTVKSLEKLDKQMDDAESSKNNCCVIGQKRGGRG